MSNHRLENLVSKCNEAFNEWNELRLHQGRLMRNGLFSQELCDNYIQKLENFMALSSLLFDAWKENYHEQRLRLEQKRNRRQHDGGAD